MTPALADTHAAVTLARSPLGGGSHGLAYHLYSKETATSLPLELAALNARTLAPMTRRDQIEKLLSSLQAARTEAEKWGFAVPSEEAMTRADALLKHLVAATNIAESIEIAVGEDGSIEITAVPGRKLVVVDIPPAGTRMEIVVQNWKSGEVVEHSSSASEDDVVRLIEHAA